MISLAVVFHPEAENEFREAITWYKNISPGIEHEFITCIDEAIQRIKRTPEAFPIVYKNYRKTVVRRFPFIIVFEVSRETIKILAVFHSRRNPKVFETREAK